MFDLDERAMMVDLSGLRAERGATLVVTCRETVASQVPEVPFDAPVEGTLTLTNLGSALRIEGRLETSVGLVCDLCATPFRYRLEASVQEEIERTGASEEASTIGLQAAADGELWLAVDALAREMLVLALPMAVRCRPDCQGLCGRCGADLRVQRCECDTETIDPRLAPLATLRMRR